MKKTVLFIFTILLLQSCGGGSKDGEQVITVEDRYSLSIPSFMTKADNLNYDASLQYQSIFRSLFVIVIDEPKEALQEALEDNDLTDVYENNFEGYTALILDGFKNNLIEPTESVMTDTIINNMPAKLTNIRGTVEKTDIFYSMGFYEGKERYYQVLTWTTNSGKDRHLSRMEKMLHSLKEL